MFLFGCTQHIIDTVNYKDIITTRKRSLGQGNGFESVCQSFYSQGGGSLYNVTSCLATWTQVPWGGVSVPGPMFIQRGVCEGALWRGVSERGWNSQYWHLVAATEVGGTHPTGIHSCFKLFLLLPKTVGLTIYPKIVKLQLTSPINDSGLRCLINELVAAINTYRFHAKINF